MIMIILISFYSGSTCYGLDSLSLKEAIDLAYNFNLEYKQAKNSFQGALITKESAWNKMYVPTVTAGITMTSVSSLGQLGDSDAQASGADYLDRGYPSTELSLTMAQYKIFDFWKDKLAYEKAELVFSNEKRRLDETKRVLRLKVIRSYFNAKFALDTREASERSFKISEAMLALVNSQHKLGKAENIDVEAARVSYSEAFRDVSFKQQAERQAVVELLALIGSNVDTNPKLTSKLNFQELKISKEKLFELFLKNSTMLDYAEKNLQLANFDYELAKKAQLPLPTVAFDGVKLAYADNYTRTKSVAETSSTPSGNLNVSTSISFTIPVFGEGGFWNSDSVKKAFISVNNAEIEIKKTKLNAIIQLENIYSSIKTEEDNQQQAKRAFEDSAQVLNSIMMKITKKLPVSRLEIKDALTSARSNELNMKSSIFQHFSQKLTLLELIGTEQIPGDKVEWND
jgi:outer membrane protein TolC